MNDQEIDEPFEESGLIVEVNNNAWPFINAVSNCWCGHVLFSHGPTDHYKGQCVECQCTEFYLDRWTAND